MSSRWVWIAISLWGFTGTAAAQPAGDKAPEAPPAPGPSASTQAPPGAQDAHDPAPPAPVAPLLDPDAPPPFLELRRSYHPDQPVPAGYKMFSEPNKGFIIPGAAVFGGLWFVSVLQSISGGNLQTEGSLQPAAIPLVGPFIVLASGQVRSDNQAGFAIVGAGQWLGVASIVTGFFVRWRVLKFQFQPSQVTLEPGFSPIAGGAYSVLSGSF